MYHNIYNSWDSEYYEKRGFESLKTKRTADNADKMHPPLKYIFEDLRLSDTIDDILSDETMNFFKRKEKEKEKEEEKH